MRDAPQPMTGLRRVVFKNQMLALLHKYLSCSAALANYIYTRHHTIGGYADTLQIVVFGRSFRVISSIYRIYARCAANVGESRRDGK